jgi:hypothetical protein
MNLGPGDLPGSIGCFCRKAMVYFIIGSLSICSKHEVCADLGVNPPLLPASKLRIPRPHPRLTRRLTQW